jgi:hypothetical protein
MQTPSAQFTGALYGLVHQTDEDRLSSLENLPGMEHKTAEIPSWTELTFRSAKSLVPNEPQASSYMYHLLLRRSGPARFLLVSAPADVGQVLLEQTRKKIQAVPPAIDVPKLVQEMTVSPTRYVISALWARVEGFGQTLRTMALYGSDIGSSRLFQSLLPQLVAHRVTLRDLTTRSEILSIGSRGEISFSYTGARSLKAVDQTLRFLSAKGYLDWTK